MPEVLFDCQENQEAKVSEKERPLNWKVQEFKIGRKVAKQN
jgi:hypothetical protein